MIRKIKTVNKKLFDNKYFIFSFDKDNYKFELFSNKDLTCKVYFNLINKIVTKNYFQNVLGIFVAPLPYHKYGQHNGRIRYPILNNKIQWNDNSFNFNCKDYLAIIEHLNVQKDFEKYFNMRAFL